MQEDFHYYATCCAAYMAGYSHEESLTIGYSAQMVDLCSMTLLTKLGAPKVAATTQLQLEMMNSKPDKKVLQDITRIWASFHFLPYDLNAECKGGKKYRNKFRLICNSDGELIADTVKLAKEKSLQAVGISMHVLADSWAHKYFAGTPSLVINNTNDHFYEFIPGKDDQPKKINFQHNPAAADDIENTVYINSIYQSDENSIMNLGHGRAGHLPDYSFIKYSYLPAWGGYREIIKDNQSDYYNAFCQMVYALKYLHGENESFELQHYDHEAVKPYEEEIKGILAVRRLLASEDWKKLGERLSGCEIEDFDVDKYQTEYMEASEEDRKDTFLGKFINAAIAHKAMVTNKIHSSGNDLAGKSL